MSTVVTFMVTWRRWSGRFKKKHGNGAFPTQTLVICCIQGVILASLYRYYQKGPYGTLLLWFVEVFSTPGRAAMAGSVVVQQLQLLRRTFGP